MISLIFAGAAWGNAYQAIRCFKKGEHEWSAIFAVTALLCVGVFAAEYAQ